MTEVKASDRLLAAVWTIIVADLVMSLDNVIAVAAAAGGHWGLLIIGLAISIPLVIFGATLLVKVMERWPVVIALSCSAGIAPSFTMTCRSLKQEPSLSWTKEIPLLSRLVLTQP